MELDVNMNRDQWLTTAREWLDIRRDLWDSGPGEALVGYVDDFQPVYVSPYLDPNEPLFVWFVFPGEGVAARIVNWISRDIFIDHDGMVHEHPEEWTLLLGAARKGGTPLLTKEMVERGANHHGP